ncbi:uncharacterized protein LOC118405179 isoform X2 [Branchiostoma floridae]|uniref:Uncharacterized protein LOC118405179 isoform X2 n=1 Tax=Branchiostoma floridae TaxID=7739 RepID=A0A9J7KFJ3_BRAFL|nr:uncharacterized protein LOC118405179 isoform X2 [Branchiostoma floridae]
MPRPRRKSFGAACQAISQGMEEELDTDRDDVSDSESSPSEPPADDPDESPTNSDVEDVLTSNMSVHVTDDAITPECMAKLQPTVVLEDCFSPNVSRQSTASPVALNNSWKASPVVGTQKQSGNNSMLQRQHSGELRSVKRARDRSGSPVHNLLSRILTKKTGTETVMSPLSKHKLSGDKSPEAAPSPDGLNPDSPGDSSAKEGLEETKTSTSTPQKDSLASTRIRLTSSPAVFESPSKSQFTRVHGSPYPPGSPQMSPVVVLHDCCTPPRGTRQTRAQRMASWYVEEDEDDEIEELLGQKEEEEEEEDVFPAPLSTSADSFFGIRVEAMAEIHGETLAESSLYHSLSSSSRRRQTSVAPVPSRRARYSLRNAKQHFKNGCIIESSDEITFISSTRTTAKELLKETRRRQRSLHFSPSPVRNKRLKVEGKTGYRVSARLQRQREHLPSSPEESQDVHPPEEDLPTASEEPSEDADGLNGHSNIVFYDEVVLCPEEDEFLEDAAIGELPHSSWSLSPPTTKPQSTGSESPPIREEPCSPPPITRHEISGSESPPIREEPCNKGTESPPIREEPCNTLSDAYHNSATASEIPPITEEKTTTEYQPITDQQSNFESEAPPVTNQTSQSKPSPSPDTIEHSTIEVHSLSADMSDTTDEDASRTNSPILEEDEDDPHEDTEPDESLRCVTVSRRGHEDTPLPGRRLSSRVAQALVEDAIIAATQVDKVNQAVEQNQDETTKGGNRKSSRNSKRKKRSPRQQESLELVTEETGPEKEDGNSEKTVVQDVYSSDRTETLVKEVLAPDVAMVTNDADVAEEANNIIQEEPMGDIPEIVFKNFAENELEEASVSPRKANFSDTTHGDEDVVVIKEVQESEDEAETRRPRRFRRPAAKPTPQASSAVKLRKGRGRKQEEDIEVIYRNKNYKPPEQKTIETIYEDPIIRKKTGEEQLVGRPMKRRVSFRNFYYPKKMNKKKASKNVKRFRRKSLEGVTVDEKLINLDRQMIGISPAKFCLPGDQMLFKFASEEASSDLVTVKEEPLDFIDEESHQVLDLSGVGPLDEEDIKQELVENQDKDVNSQGGLLEEGTEPPAEPDSTTVTGRSGRKRRRSSVKVKTEVLDEESESQLNSESDDHIPRNSKPKKPRRRSTIAKQDSIASLYTEMSSSASETKEEGEASQLSENMSLSSSESTTTCEQDSKVAQCRKKKARRKSIRMNKPGDLTRASDAQSSDLDSIDLVIDAVIGEKYLPEQSDQTMQCGPQEDLHSVDGKGRGQKAKTKGQTEGIGSKGEDEDQNVDTTENTEVVGLTEKESKTAKLRSRRRSLLLTQQSSSAEDDNTEVSNSDKAKSTSQETVKAKKTPRRKSVVPPTLEDASSATEDQHSTEEECSSSSVSERLKKKGRRRSTVLTTKQDTGEDVCQQNFMTEEQEDGYSTESSVTNVAVRRRSRRKSVCSQPMKEQGVDTDQSEEASATESVAKRRSRRKSVLVQQSSSEDCSQPMKEQGLEITELGEASATASVTKRRPRRRSLAIQREGSSSEESIEPAHWSGSEFSCDVPLPENTSVKKTRNRRQSIVPDSTTWENADPAPSESGESQASTVSSTATTRRSRRRSVLLKMSSEIEEVQLSEKVPAVEKEVESYGDVRETSSVLKEVPTGISAENDTENKTSEHQSNNELNPSCISSQESGSSQSVDGFGGLEDGDLPCASRRKRKRRKSVLLKQFKWAGESPPEKALLSEKFPTKDEDKKQIEETQSLSQQTSEEGLENVQDSQEDDDVVVFNFNVSQKERELEGVQSDSEAASLSAKKAKTSACSNNEVKSLTSVEMSDESSTDSQPQVSTKRARRKSEKKAEDKIVTASSSKDIPQGLRKDDEVDGSHLQEVHSDLQTGTQSVRRQKRKRTTLIPSSQNAEEVPECDLLLEDKTETSPMPVSTKGSAVIPVPTDVVDDILLDDKASRKQPKRKSRQLSAYFNQRTSQKTTSSEDQAQEFETPNKVEASKTTGAVVAPNEPPSPEDFVTKKETFMDDRDTEAVIDEPKRKVRRQSSRFRRVTPKKTASPETKPAPDKEMMFEEDFVTNEDTFIDNEQMESLINSIAEGSTPIGSPCKTVSPKVADVNVENYIKKKPVQKKGKTAKKNVGKRGATRRKKNAELSKTPKGSSPPNSQPESKISPKLHTAESNKTVETLNGVCTARKEKKVKNGGKSLSPTANVPRIPHKNGKETTAMLSPKSQNSLKKTPSSALQNPSSKGRSSKKNSPVDTHTSLSQPQKQKAVVKQPPQSPESVLSPTSRHQGRQVTSLFSVLSASASSPDANQTILGAMPSFKSLVKHVVSPDTSTNSRQPTLDESCEARKASTQPSASYANKTNSLKQPTGSKSVDSTPFSVCGKSGHSENQTPQTAACDSDVANTFSCPGNTTWNDSASSSAKSKSFAFAKTYSVKQHWAKRFVNTKDTYLNKFKMFAFGSPSSQSSTEENE